MRSPIGGLRNVKIFVLYLMQNIREPLDYITLSEIVLQTDFVIYLDLAEAFYAMVDDGLVAEAGKNEAGETTYLPTEKGICVAESLHSDLLPSILDESLAAALRYLDFKRRGVKVSCQAKKNDLVGYDVHCVVKEKDLILLDVTLWADSETRAEAMAEQFRNRPEKMYRGITALFAGNINYLLDD